MLLFTMWTTHACEFTWVALQQEVPGLVEVLAQGGWRVSGDYPLRDRASFGRLGNLQGQAWASVIGFVVLVKMPY